MASHIESDEAYARQLQAQEMGLRTMPQDLNQRTPLIRDPNENPTVINTRLNELSSARATVIAIFLVHVPQVGLSSYFPLNLLHWLLIYYSLIQIIAAAILLPLHWSDSGPCDDIHRNVKLRK